MVVLDTVQTFLKYSDWANQHVVRCSFPLSAEQLDRSFKMGMGSLRRTLLHIYHGEHVWLQRWKSESVAWPPEDESVSMITLAERFRKTWEERAAYLETLSDSEMDRFVVYVDSSGGYFRAKLGHMLIEGCLHSTHHRAQAVNMLRQLDAETPELDYIMWIRRPTTRPT